MAAARPAATGAAVLDPLFYPRALRRAAALAGVETAALKSPRRDRHLVRARWTVWLALQRRGWTNSSTARRMRLDQTTVSYGIREAIELERRDPHFATAVAKVAAA